MGMRADLHITVQVTEVCPQIDEPKLGFHDPLLSIFSLDGVIERNQSSAAIWRAKVSLQVPDTTQDAHSY